MIALTDILQDMRANKTRLLLTILSIAWGTLVIASMLAIGQGLRTTFVNAVSSVGKNLITVEPGETTVRFRGLQAGVDIAIRLQDVRDIKQSVKGLIGISAETIVDASLIHGSKNYMAQIHAVDPDYGRLRNVTPAQGGRFINWYDNHKAARVVFLGDKVVESLFDPGVNPVGKTVLISGFSFRVIGVMKKKYELSHMGVPDDYLVFMPANTLEELAGRQPVSQFVLVVKKPKDNKRVINQIQRIIALNHHASPDDSGVVQVVDNSAVQARTNLFFTGMQWFLGLVGAMTLIVAGVGVANVMYVSVSQSIREIGIRMAVGAKASDILWQYITESVLTTTLGGALGLLLSYGLVTLLDSVRFHGRFFAMVGQPKPELSISVVLIVVLVLGVVGLAAGVFPAREAAKIDPAIALRR